MMLSNKMVKMMMACSQKAPLKGGCFLSRHDDDDDDDDVDNDNHNHDDDHHL